MKKLLLLGCFSLCISAIWGQERKSAPGSLPAVMHMQAYLDSIERKNEAQLKKTLDMFKNKKTVLTNDNLGLTFISPGYIHKNVMPVLVPGSNYVYNMPGTHAFDKSKAKGGAIFVTEQPNILSLKKDSPIKK